MNKTTNALNTSDIKLIYAKYYSIVLTKVILGIFWAILETDTWEPMVELTRNDPKGHATRNDIVDDIVDDSLSTIDFNFAKIASSASIVTKSSTLSLRVAEPLVIFGIIMKLVMCPQIVPP